MENKDIAKPAISAEARRDHVAQTNASMALEGLVPDESDIALQQAYIAGTASTDDLLRAAHAYAAQAKAGGK